VRLIFAAVVGVGIGFMSGLLGKGGSAIATPLLHAIGFPAIVAVAAPLPATIPSTFVAGSAYARQRLIDWRVVRWSIVVGVPATVAGAVLTRWIRGEVLVQATDLVLIGLGMRLLWTWKHQGPQRPVDEHPATWKLALVAAVVGVISGLLANSGGFLLAPLFVTALRFPIKRALGSSLAVSCVLAIPGTVVHAALGHIDWTLVAVFGSTAVPLSFIGARVGLRTDATRLEGIYGMALVILGGVFFGLR
jgi:uncharacterized protein